MRTITVRGTGKVSVPPDTIELRLTLEAKDMEYAAAMEKAAGRIEALQGAILAAGFGEKALKTTDFSVRSEYDNVQDDKGRWQQVFTGYVCHHGLLLRFGLDMDRLAAALAAAADCGSEPQIQIAFTVADPRDAEDALLRDAAENARRLALTLCAASGVRLGALDSIRYNWEEANVRSETSMDMGAKPMLRAAKAGFDNAFVPEDVKLTETAVFTWEIE